jgi:hypothetical protein
VLCHMLRRISMFFSKSETLEYFRVWDLFLILALFLLLLIFVTFLDPCHVLFLNNSIFSYLCWGCFCLLLCSVF